ncbi:hypothetical protein EVAR_70928_1 [Eumeta japonica]|uniref:Uncharacterized protein n=1 Tax=Eumeta variegata TaxID=151549 RepID=A0A4C1SAW3_EUMVA|nr:hypothetical protein EVAR_70928_1 [Eumeta japonica]
MKKQLVCATVNNFGNDYRGKEEEGVHSWLCVNCLARSHVTEEYTSADVCQKCGWAHRTLLHMPNKVSFATNQLSRGNGQASRISHFSSRSTRMNQRRSRSKVNIHSRPSSTNRGASTERTRH